MLWTGSEPGVLDDRMHDVEKARGGLIFIVTVRHQDDVKQHARLEDGAVAVCDIQEGVADLLRLVDHVDDRADGLLVDVVERQVRDRDALRLGWQVLELPKIHQIEGLALETRHGHNATATLALIVREAVLVEHLEAIAQNANALVGVWGRSLHWQLNTIAGCLLVNRLLRCGHGPVFSDCVQSPRGASDN